jgi:replication factor A1
MMGQEEQKAANGGRDNDKANRSSNLNLICEINESLQNENDTDQYHFYFLNGYVSRIKNDDRIFYPACMSDNCRRKVTEDAQGWRCEHCNKTFMTYRPTYMITAKISDFTDSIYVNFAREHGAALMGK